MFTSLTMGLTIVSDNPCVGRGTARPLVETA
jgi:hypothetical protein